MLCPVQDTFFIAKDLYEKTGPYIVQKAFLLIDEDIKSRGFRREEKLIFARNGREALDFPHS